MKDTEQHAWLDSPEGHAHRANWTGVNGKPIREPWPHLLVARCIAMHCDDNGVAYPGIPRIAAHAHRSERQVRESIKMLEHNGWMQTTRGPGSRNRYRVMYPESASDSLTKPAHFEQPAHSDSADDCAGDRAGNHAGNRAGNHAGNRAGLPHETDAEGRGSEVKGGEGVGRVEGIVASIAATLPSMDPTHGNRHPQGNPDDRPCRQCRDERLARKRQEAEQVRIAREVPPFDPANVCDCGSLFSATAAASCPDTRKHRAQPAA